MKEYLENYYGSLAESASFYYNGGIESPTEKEITSNLEALKAYSKFMLNIKYLKSFVNG